jgi:hypothetical protein
VAEVCRSSLGTTSFVAAAIAAITLSPIAAAAYPENGAAFTPAAKPLTQNIIYGVSHSHPKARLDNGRRSCQLNDGGWTPLTREVLPKRTPIGGTIGASPSQPSARLYTTMMMNCTPSAWMMLRYLFRRVFKKLHFWMIDDILTFGLRIHGQLLQKGRSQDRPF